MRDHPRRRRCRVSSRSASRWLLPRQDRRSWQCRPLQRELGRRMVWTPLSKAKPTDHSPGKSRQNTEKARGKLAYAHSPVNSTLAPEPEGFVNRKVIFNFVNSVRLTTCSAVPLNNSVCSTHAESET